MLSQERANFFRLKRHLPVSILFAAGVGILDQKRNDRHKQAVGHEEIKDVRRAGRMGVNFQREQCVVEEVCKHITPLAQWKKVLQRLVDVFIASWSAAIGMFPIDIEVGRAV
mmetsp:Transcript_8623/g.17248  ORF Transcript_8623/g.17248 Transcript_8623/m.17248 type:complete len:112 (-) Transcript_8623:649-984(-)